MKNAEFSRPDHLYTDIGGIPGARFGIPYAGVNSAPSQRLHIITQNTGKPAPLIIYIHGGGWNALNSKGHSALYTCEAALRGVERGYAVAIVDYRLLSECGTIRGVIADVKRAIRFLRAHCAEYGLDPARFALHGESAGGHLALLAAAVKDDARYDDPYNPETEASCAVQAVAAWYPVTNIDRQMARLLFGLGADDGISEDALRTYSEFASPYCRADAGFPPCLLQHGLEDTEVPYTQSCLMYNKLRLLGVDAELDLFPGYDHAVAGFIGEKNSKRMLDWLDSVLRNNNCDNA